MKEPKSWEETWREEKNRDVREEGSLHLQPLLFRTCYVCEVYVNWREKKRES